MRPAMNLYFALLLVITALVLGACAHEEPRSTYQQTSTTTTGYAK